MRILTEASGSPVSAFMTNAIKEAGHFAIGSDIRANCHSSIISDHFIIMPKTNDPSYWLKMEKIIKENNIDFVIPSLDETLMGWAERKEFFCDRDVKILISAPETIEKFEDKWNTHIFFKSINVPCPNSSLDAVFPVIKPRRGRGSEGVIIINNAQDRDNFQMSGCISQDLASGQEYTVDCLFSHIGEPIYIIPRRREAVVSGKSMDGVVDLQPEIISHITKISKEVNFLGPINVQVFLSGAEINFIEINPRIAGGMALGFAASENWIPLMIDICDGINVVPKSIQNGRRMYRYYKEAFC